MDYPIYRKLENLSKDMAKGNFGLWYNKFIPVANFESCKASDEKGDDKNAVVFYFDKYNKIQKDTIKTHLNEKHRDQAGFCDAFSSRYETVIFKAKLKTPLITGIGESHPHEVSMVFDHNLGIPYIPASGIKGIVRFTHTLSLLLDENGNFTNKYVEEENGKEFIRDDNKETLIPQLFGTQKKRGAVIFLDAYPEKVPDLHVDIMNPHYGDYYGDDTNRTPPADYLNPVPIKFLTVAKDTFFIFRALVDKEQPELIGKVKAAFRKVLTEEGVGAKTAVGYGLFDIGEDEGKKLPVDGSAHPKSPPLPEKKTPDPEIWESAVLSWTANTGAITAKWEGKNATTKDKAIIPESLLEQLKKKKKPVTAKVKVELIGGKEYRLVEIVKAH